MPAKNSRKIYLEDSYYHIYNRGHNLQTVYFDSKDYHVFLKYLRIYLSPAPAVPILRLKNYADDIKLLCYCLMPNHFHLLLKQRTNDGITRFLHSLTTKYCIYINRRYHRTGSLFQGRYKAVRVTSDQQLLYLSKYIHTNPRPYAHDLSQYPYSSYLYYLTASPDWLNTTTIKNYFKSTSAQADYRDFIENMHTTQQSIRKLVIE